MQVTASDLLLHWHSMPVYSSTALPFPPVSTFISSPDKFVRELQQQWIWLKHTNRGSENTRSGREGWSAAELISICLESRLELLPPWYGNPQVRGSHAYMITAVRKTAQLSSNSILQRKHTELKEEMSTAPFPSQTEFWRVTLSVLYIRKPLKKQGCTLIILRTSFEGRQEIGAKYS